MRGEWNQFGYQQVGAPIGVFPWKKCHGGRYVAHISDFSAYPKYPQVSEGFVLEEVAR